MSLLISTPSRRRRFFSPKSYFWLWITNFHTAHKGREEHLFFDIFCHTKKYCGPGFFPRRNLMKLFFPNQKRQQIALAKNQDGARGDDLPNQHKTGTLDCPRRNFAKLFFQSNKYSRSCLRTSRTAPAGMIYEIKRRLRSRIFSKRILAKMIFPNQQRQRRRRCWAAIARRRIPK